MTQTQNPYTSPPSSAEPALIDRQLPFSAVAREIFIGWERLRIVYLVILGILTLLLVGWQIQEWTTLKVIVVGATTANICFFAGPVLETYLRWLGFQSHWIRWGLFTAGTMFTAFLALVTLLSTMLNTLD